MAIIETWFDQDIKQPVCVRHLGGNVFNADNMGNRIGVRMFNNKTPVNLTGNVTAYCVLASGISVPVAGTVSGNSAYIDLPNAAYAVPGTINIIIKNVNGSTVTTIAAITSSVIGIGGVVADPSAETIAAWTAQINATITALQNGAVRYDTTQSLSAAQKTQARGNIGANTSAVNIVNSDYKIVVP